MSQKDEEISKGQKVFIKRLLSGVLTFFVIAIVQFVLHVVDTNGTNEALACLNSILNGTGGTSYNGGTGGGSDRQTTTMDSECIDRYLTQYNNCLSSGHVSKATCDANYPMCVDKKTAVTTTKDYLTTTKINKTKVVAEAVGEYLVKMGIGDAAYIAGITAVCTNEFQKAWKAEIEDWDITAKYKAQFNCGREAARLTIEKYEYNYNTFISMLDDIISGLGMKLSYEACKNYGYYDINLSVNDRLVNCMKKTYCQEGINQKKCQADISNNLNNIPKNGESCYEESKLTEEQINSGDYYFKDGKYCIANYSITISYEEAKQYCIAESTKCIEFASENK